MSIGIVASSFVRAGGGGGPATFGATATYVSGGDQATHDVNIPAHSAGDRLVLIIASDNIGNVTDVADLGGDSWSLLKDLAYSTLVSLYVYEIKARSAGSSTTTVTVTMGSSQTISAICVQVTGSDSSKAAEASTGVSGSGGSWPDPDSVSPSWATSVETLFLAIIGQDRWAGVSAAPSGYSNLTTRPATSLGGAMAGVASKNATTSSEDPGYFTATVTDDWCAVTVAVASGA